MRQSHLFTKTRKESPTDEVSKNAQLLIRAGYLHKEIAGVYSLLPLGLRVIKNLAHIIRDEMNKIGGQEMEMSTLQDPEIWKKTDRWDDEKVDNWFKTTLKNEQELGLGFTHEEAISRIMSEHISSYRQLPVYGYQIQTKFRNELRAKSGIMRGREFLMKDLYSFSRSDEEHEVFYEKSKEAYKNVFDRCGIGEQTFLTFASGGVFAPFSHEFQMITDAGEDTMYLSREKGIAVNKEVYTDEVLEELNLNRDELEEVTSVEVGNIFTLGTKFSEPLGLTFTDEDGSEKPVIMGSYGIGLGRLMGAITELLSDDKGLVWPEEVSPYQVHLVSLGTNNEDVVTMADGVYSALTEFGVEVLYDDRDVMPGEKLADSDLLGISTRIVIGRKTLESGEIEVVDRVSGKTSHIPESEIMAGRYK